MFVNFYDLWEGGGAKLGGKEFPFINNAAETSVKFCIELSLILKIKNKPIRFNIMSSLLSLLMIYGLTCCRACSTIAGGGAAIKKRKSIRRFLRRPSSVSCVATGRRSA